MSSVSRSGRLLQGSCSSCSFLRRLTVSLRCSPCKSGPSPRIRGGTWHDTICPQTERRMVRRMVPAREQEKTEGAHGQVDGRSSITREIYIIRNMDIPGMRLLPKSSQSGLVSEYRLVD